MKNQEGIATIEAPEDMSLEQLMDIAKKGISFKTFESIVVDSPFDLAAWSELLHISDRTIQRYRKENKSFSLLHSEKILEIALICRKGVEIFGEKEKFNVWLNSKILALGGKKPVEFMDSSFGLELLNGELTRIDHGIFV